MTRKRTIAFLALLLVGLGIASWRLSDSAPPMLEASEGGAIPASHADDESPDGKMRRRMLGVWHDRRKPNRLLTMTLNADGTGEVLVELSGADAIAIWATQLRFDMRWNFAGNRFTSKMVGGEPADRIKIVMTTTDTSGDNTLLEFTDDRLLLLDRDGKTEHDWRREGKRGN